MLSGLLHALRCLMTKLRCSIFAGLETVQQIYYLLLDWREKRDLEQYVQISLMAQNRIKEEIFDLVTHLLHLSIVLHPHRSDVRTTKELEENLAEIKLHSKSRD